MGSLSWWSRQAHCNWNGLRYEAERIKEDERREGVSSSCRWCALQMEEEVTSQRCCWSPEDERQERRIAGKRITVPEKGVGHEDISWAEGKPVSTQVGRQTPRAAPKLHRLMYWQHRAAELILELASPQPSYYITKTYAPFWVRSLFRRVSWCDSQVCLKQTQILARLLGHLCERQRGWAFLDTKVCNLFPCAYMVHPCRRWRPSCCPRILLCLTGKHSTRQGGLLIWSDALMCGAGDLRWFLPGRVLLSQPTTRRGVTLLLGSEAAVLFLLSLPSCSFSKFGLAAQIIWFHILSLCLLGLFLDP